MCSLTVKRLQALITEQGAYVMRDTCNVCLHAYNLEIVLIKLHATSILIGTVEAMQCFRVIYQ